MRKKKPVISYNKLSRIYIASPYSYTNNLPIIGKLVSKVVRMKREREVSRFTAKLLESVYGPFAAIGPITQSHRLARFMTRKETGFNAWRDIDFTLIEACDMVFVLMLDGWKESKGVREEIAFATSKGIPVLYFRKDLVLVTDDKSYEVK